MDVSIIIPVYNEEKAIESTIEEVKETLSKAKHKFEIIAVNDGSKDKSKALLEKQKGIHVINHPYNLGYGASLKSGIKASKYDWILITDADGTYPIKDIPGLLQHAGTYDMVVGARVGKHVKVPLLRKPAKKILSWLANFMVGKKIPDLNSGFRVFRKSLAKEFFHLFPSGFSFTSTITLASLSNDYKVRYIPIDYFKRKGKSSIHPVKDFIGFLSLIIRIVMYFKPLKFFMLPSLLLLLFGVIATAYQLIVNHNIAQLPIILILTGLQIAFLGLIADMIVKVNKKQNW